MSFVAILTPIRGIIVSVLVVVSIYPRMYGLMSIDFLVPTYSKLVLMHHTPQNLMALPHLALKYHYIFLINLSQIVLSPIFMSLPQPILTLLIYLISYLLKIVPTLIYKPKISLNTYFLFHLKTHLTLIKLFKINLLLSLSLYPSRVYLHPLSILKTLII